MKLGTKLALSVSLIIVVALVGYGYFHILTRRDVLIRKMKVEVGSIGQTLKVSLEKVLLPRNMQDIQELIDAVSEYEKTLGIIVYLQDKDIIFHSASLQDDFEPFLRLIKMSIRQDLTHEEFGRYGKASIFSYTFPLRDRRGEKIGGVSVLQYASPMEDELRKTKWTIFIVILVLMGGTITVVLLITRRSISQPIAKLLHGIHLMTEGNLDTRIDLRRGDELSEVAHAFNQMAVNLKEAQDRIIQDSETKLELERTLRQSEKLATIGQLASGLAHEIGTPLNIIGGRTEIAQRKLDDKELVQKTLATIAQQTERITKIIQQLLGFVRKKRPEQKALRINSILETTLDLLEHQIQKQGVKVAKDLREDLPSALGDQDQLQQVFLNIILNAIQSMPEGGELDVSSTCGRISKEGLEDGGQEYVTVCVRDTGMGMDKDVLEKLFNPFFTTKNTGTGLGLMVSQGVVQDHEGWIDVESDVGKGSVFRVYLPVCEEEVRRDG